MSLSSETRFFHMLLGRAISWASNDEDRGGEPKHIHNCLPRKVDFGGSSAFLFLLANQPALCDTSFLGLGFPTNVLTSAAKLRATKYDAASKAWSQGSHLHKTAGRTNSNHLRIMYSFHLKLASAIFSFHDRGCKLAGNFFLTWPHGELYALSL